MKIIILTALLIIATPLSSYAGTSAAVRYVGLQRIKANNAERETEMQSLCKDYPNYPVHPKKSKKPKI